MDRAIRVQLLATLGVLEGVCAGLPGKLWLRFLCLLIGVVLAYLAAREATNA